MKKKAKKAKATSACKRGKCARLTHVDASGAARMVDVGAKEVTDRVAVAQAELRMKPGTLRKIVGGEMPKGNVLEVARLAGVMAAKRTSELIPLCHPLNLTHVAVDLTPKGRNTIRITSEVRVRAQTGVEMEALTAVSVAALTLYDMCKAVDRGMVIADIHLVRKRGGKSGHFEFGRST